MSIPDELTPVEEHLAEILAAITPLTPPSSAWTRPTAACWPRTCPRPAPLPSFDNSGMDGYAVRAEDVAAATEATPVTLPVTARSRPATPGRTRSSPAPPSGS